MRWEMVNQGTVDAIAMRPAVLENVPAVLLVHNHPSGDPTPSPEDVQTTEHTMAAGKLLSIDMLDHVVLGKDGRFTSLVARGMARQRDRPVAA